MRLARRRSAPSRVCLLLLLSIPASADLLRFGDGSTIDVDEARVEGEFVRVRCGEVVFRLERSCFRELPPTDDASRAESLAELVRASEDDPDPLVRAEALRALQSRDETEARHAVVRALDDVDPTPRAVALEVLSGDAELLPTPRLLEILDAESELAPRVAAVEALGRRREAGTRLATLLEDPSQAIRQAARAALRRLSREGGEK